MKSKNINNEKIENMFYDAQKSLPTTNLEWRISDMTEQRKETKKYPVWKKIAACIACVLAFGIGGVTMLANAKMDIDPGEYGQWLNIKSEENWKTCQQEMKRRGCILPESIGEYTFGDFSTMLVAKHGTTYLDALRNNVYNPMDVSFYYKGEPEQGVISVYIGTLEEAYWSAYFGFELIEDTWVASEAEQVLEYEGMTIYGSPVHYESGDKMIWKWMDEKNGVCFSVFVPVDPGTEYEEDSTEVVKIIIDANRFSTV